ncbi:MAG: CDP-alcohol phosphatidyltransferase family protein [Chlamydiales bacterium]|nr:CDP-alcohol phosphatidyltransferase family protein [Chlamydiia bacterium]MCP5507733.1 CDP-alcohol phosphatidyltransferase family protein [Chlamydiales bacterium]
MITIPNILSFLRFPLALLFLWNDIKLRVIAIVIASLTDFLDGFLARRYAMRSRIGTILDPISDKFFVLFALGIFIGEGRISPFEATAMLCRDFAVIIFGIFLTARGQMATYQFRSIWCGKITTTLQLAVLLLLTFGFIIPTYIYSVFVVLGLAALGELYYVDHSPQSQCDT